jgi:ring-1,2-phenylacetyl-CoA epoxidase subunit PaaD
VNQADLARAWEVLRGVPDPEIPVISICDLGIVRGLEAQESGLHVVLTPTYSGCPATEQIESSVVSALETAGLGPVRVSLQRAPAWTTDWITEAGRRSLHDYGIAPPAPASTENESVLRFIPQRKITPLACPRCASLHTERLSAYGSTACKALYRCLACREPFEYFKPF